LSVWLFMTAFRSVFVAVVLHNQVTGKEMVSLGGCIASLAPPNGMQAKAGSG
jgi:hypothetical protein